MKTNSPIKLLRFNQDLFSGPQIQKLVGVNEVNA